jgi:hypothetical protein
VIHKVLGGTIGAIAICSVALLPTAILAGGDEPKGALKDRIIGAWAFTRGSGDTATVITWTFFKDGKMTTSMVGKKVFGPQIPMESTYRVLSDKEIELTLLGGTKKAEVIIKGDELQMGGRT